MYIWTPYTNESLLMYSSDRFDGSIIIMILNGANADRAVTD